MQGLQICKIPCSAASLATMVQLIKAHGPRNSPGITFNAFHAFMAAEFTAGHNLLHSDYQLPNGQHLPFNLTIKRMKRHYLLHNVMQGGAARDVLVRQFFVEQTPDTGQVRSCLYAWRAHGTPCASQEQLFATHSQEQAYLLHTSRATALPDICNETQTALAPCALD